MKDIITRVDALNFAIDTINTYRENDTAVCDILAKIRDQIAKPRKTSDEAKAKAKAKRADARSALMVQVLPILRDTLTMYPDGLTAKALYETCAETLPKGFSTAKVQYILLNEMKDEVIKIEAKSKPNIYRLK